MLYLFVKYTEYSRKEYMVHIATATAAWATVHSELVKVSEAESRSNRGEGVRASCGPGLAFLVASLKRTFVFAEGAGLRLAFHSWRGSPRCRRILRILRPLDSKTTVPGSSAISMTSIFLPSPSVSWGLQRG